MHDQKSLYIVTSNDYLIYQPTVLNIYDELKSHFNVEIISFEPHFISKQKDTTRNTVYITIPFAIRFFFQNLDYGIQLLIKLLNRTGLNLLHRNSYYNMLQRFYLDRYVRRLKADMIIAVDIAALTICQKYFSGSEFLSLEIYMNDPYMKQVDLGKIDSVFIQNKPRFEYLFGSSPLNTFYVQNAPTFKNEYIKDYDRNGLVWAGSIVKRFAVLDCIEFIRTHPQYSLTLKGGSEKKTLAYINTQYADLVANKNLVIDQVYLSNDDFIDFLSHFRIGFCFYSWDLIKSSINYQTAPSGKLFMCLAAGVPVIASNISGFQFVREFRAGILVDDYEPETIRKAIELIEADYENYRQACYDSARYYSFESNVKPYINYLTEKGNVK